MNEKDIKDLVLNSKENNKIIFIKKVFNEVPRWETFHDIFNKALSKNLANLSSPGTLGIYNSEKHTDKLNAIIKFLESVHPGTKISVLSIIHFMNANNNAIPEAAESFYGDFVASNPNKIPPGFDYGLLQPKIHSDPVDGFYIQCEGQTTWRAFYKDGNESYLVNPGDLLYIPKGINHSVESMNVRAAISVSFFDE
jgi:mannose-6-phosphate isomerase-like protein (cupin superfamily)